jgi:MYND finger
MNSKKELEKNFDMEEINPKTVRFFEGLLKHGPIREVLIKQLMILDSLTLIRLMNDSPATSNYIKDNADIWIPRIKQQMNQIYYGRWPIKYYEESDEFPGMYMTSVIFFYFPTLFDVFLFFVSFKPHVWLPEKAAFQAEIETTRDVITCQDWDVKFKDQNNAFNLDYVRNFYIYDAYSWTKSKNKNEKGKVANYHMEQVHSSSYLKFTKQRQFHQLEIVPRIGYWFKYFEEDVSFVLTRKIPKEPWPKCNVSLNVVTKFAGGEYFFVFNNYNLSKIEIATWYEKNIFRKNAILLEDEDEDGFHFLHIKGGKNQISPYFNVTFFIAMTAFRVYVFSEDIFSRFRAYKNFREMRETQEKNDVILVVETILPFRHFAKEDQMEFLIESCVECQKPATLQCSGCNRAVYCGEECGKKSWEQGLHSEVCKHI